MVNERLGRLKAVRADRRRSSVVQSAEAAGKAGQATKLSEAAVRQGARRQTWMGPAWMGSTSDNIQVSTV